MCTKNDSPEYYSRDLLAATVQFLLVALILLGGKTVPVYASVGNHASMAGPERCSGPTLPAVIPFKGADSPIRSRSATTTPARRCSGGP